MVELFFTPTWFHGWDILVEGIIVIIALLIAGYSWRIYHLNHENRFMYFALAFMLLALGLLFKNITSSINYFTPVRNSALEVLRPIAGPHLQFTPLLYRSGFLLQMMSFLGAWLLIFFISQKSRSRLTQYYEVSQIALFIYLIVLISVVSNFKYFVFYLTSSVILGMTVLNYYKNYLNTNRNTNAYLVMWSFLLILFSHLFFVFVFLFESFYVIGELLLLLGFLVLLFAYRRVINTPSRSMAR